MNREEGDSRSKLSGYAVFNTSVMIKNIAKDLVLKASLNNVFDKKYYDPSSYDSNHNANKDDYLKNGRNFFVELKYKF